ncbi:MAG: biotin carboxylase N-terminal domain-containing protein [Burkholderiales bacterium]
MFKKILIANRGEIACRVATTARRLGIATVAVYSDADAQAQHVRVCDEAIGLGGTTPQESYLLADKILQAALQSGAQAVHPGYGFLSENEDFAQACFDHGLVFIGPPAQAIAAMGSKSAAKALMQRAGVPLVPGYHGTDQTPVLLQQEAEKIGFPVLIKASAGGGGKGMRVVERASDFLAALASCQREARNAFGDDQVLIEKYLTRPRHIEVQVFADQHGHCLYLFERDCSAQRRHQKVLEEAPAPGMTAERRRQMGEAAVAAAQAVGYVGAGTVEFIAEGEAFYFMEMNTRLQVEHPVTEMITGLDLVEWQLRVAAGEALPLEQSQLSLQGHAIEARLYAENPAKGFLPSMGRLQQLSFPAHVAFQVHQDHARARVRIDSGVSRGDTITPYYDPMIAKLIAWGETRAQALHTLRQALIDTRLVGVAHNVSFLRRLIEHPDFQSGAVDTGLIGRHADSLCPDVALSAPYMALAVAALLEQEAHKVQADPWSNRDGWRCGHDYRRTLLWRSAEQQAQTDLHYLTAGLQLGIQIGTAPISQAADFSYRAQGEHYQVWLNGQSYQGHVIVTADAYDVFYQGEVVRLCWFDPLLAAAGVHENEGSLSAPMPGKIVSLLATPGQMVDKGTPLLVMEAMKMEHTILAPAAGVVEAFLFAPGDQVSEGATLLQFRSTEDQT